MNEDGRQDPFRDALLADHAVLAVEHYAQEHLVLPVALRSLLRTHVVVEPIACADPHISSLIRFRLVSAATSAVDERRIESYVSGVNSYALVRRRGHRHHAPDAKK